MTVVAVINLTAASCAQLLDLDEFGDQSQVSSGGSGSAGYSGAGGTEQSPCTPGTQRDCYQGPAGTDGVGLCKAGKHTCDLEGAEWGECAGQVLPEDEDCSNPEDEDCDGKSCSRAFWNHAYSWARLGDVAIDAEGNVYIAGYFNVTSAFPGGAPLVNAGGNDVFVAKLNPLGGHLWSKRFGDSQTQSARYVAVDRDGGVVVAGEFLGGLDFGGDVLVNTRSYADMFVVKLDRDGNPVWAKQYGGTGLDTTRGLEIDPQGAVVLAGEFEGVADFGNGPVTSFLSDLVVLKHAAAGNILWSETFGAERADRLGGISVDSSGSILLTGSFVGEGTIGGRTVWGPSTDGNMFLVKLDPSGVATWVTALGNSSSTVGGRLVAVGSTGQVVAVARFSGAVEVCGQVLTSRASDFFLVEHRGPNGMCEWVVRVVDGDSMGVADFDGLLVDGRDDIVVGGTYYDYVDFGGGPIVAESMTGQDAFLVKLDSRGRFVWRNHYGDGVDFVHSMALGIHAGTRDIVYGGEFSGTLSLGRAPLNEVNWATFVAKIAP